MTSIPAPFNPAAIRAVVFDGYGTLFAFHNLEFRVALAELLGEQGLDCDAEAFYERWVRLYGRAGVWGAHFPPSVAGDEARLPDEARRAMLDGPLPDWHSTHEIWRRQFEYAFAEHGLEGDAVASADRLRHLLSYAEPYPDARETLDHLDALGFRLGLMSNADEDFLQSALSRGRLRFSVIQSSESLRAYKPHRAPFLAVCARLHCDPDEVLYVGDSPIADVNGAANAGLRTAWVRRSETTEYPERLARPDVTIDALADLVEVLRPEHPATAEGATR